MNGIAQGLLALPLEVRLVLLFLGGACWGSLLNLLTYRLAYFPRPWSPWDGVWQATLGRWLPAGEPPPPVVGGSSSRGSRRDSRRKKPVPPPPPPPAWMKHVPIWGWYARRGEESRHGAGFWRRPLLVEFGCGLLAAGLYWWEVGRGGLLPPAWGNPAAHLAMLHAQYFAHLLLASLMLVASLIDLDELMIPDAVTVTGTVLGLSLAAVWPQIRLPATGPLPMGIPGLLHAASPNVWPLAWAPGATWGLAIGLFCIGGWSFALMPRVWRTRRGLGMACRIFSARLARETWTYIALVVGLLIGAGAAAVWQWGGAERWESLLSALIGVAIGGGIVWSVRLIGAVVLQREAMGFGDVTLVAMIGAFLGWQPCLLLFFIGPFFGLVPALAQAFSRRGVTREIPYGPFLCLGALTTILLWRRLWAQIVDVLSIGWLIPAMLLVCGALMIVLLGGLQLLKAVFARRPERSA